MHVGKEGKDEDGCNSSWGEDVTNGTVALLIGGDNSAKFSDASSDDFTKGNDVDLVIVFDSMLSLCFPLIMPVVFPSIFYHP